MNRSVIRYLGFSVILCACLFVSGCVFHNNGEKFVGQPVPSTRLTMLDGDYVGIEQFHGKTVVLVFWATWCHQSRPIMTRLNEFAQRINRSDIVFLAVSIDKAEKLSELRDRIKYEHLTGFKHAFSGNEESDETWVALDGDALPYIFVIDPNGVVIAAGKDDDIVYKALNIPRR
jgi:peroxiredoxin